SVSTVAANGSSISDLELQMPNSGASHGIQINRVDRFLLERISISGVEAGDYALRFDDCFTMAVRDVVINTGGHGMGFINVDQVLNYGNGVIENVFISMSGPGNNTVGFDIDGGTGSRLYNLMVFNYISAQTGAAHPNTMVGIRLRAASLCQFNLANLEGLDTGIEYVGVCGDNVFIAPYTGNLTNPYLFGAFSRRTVILGGTPGRLIDASDSVFQLDRQNFVEGRDTLYYSRRRKFEWEDDFIGGALDARWNQAAGTWTIQNARFGVVRSTTGAVSGDNSLLNFGSIFPFKLEHGLIFETRFNRVETGNHLTWCGLSDGGRAGTNRYLLAGRAGDGNFYYRARDGGTETAITNIAVGVSPIVLRIEYRPSPHAAEFSVFDIDYVLLDSDSITTNIPGTTFGLQPHLENETQTAAARNMDVDYVLTAMGRR
ncbi:MAG: hypothetical protein V3U45_07995, partial [bacterium]